jgi:hypothetical protein
VGRALLRLSAGGATSVLDALFAAITLSDTGERPLIVLFSDGEDNMSWLAERQLRSVAERSNAVVHVVSWLLPPVIVHGLPGPRRGRRTSRIGRLGIGALRGLAWS